MDKPLWNWETPFGRAVLNLKYWAQHMLEDIQDRRTMKRVLGDIHADITMHRLLRGEDPRICRGDPGSDEYDYDETTGNINDIEGGE